MKDIDLRHIPFNWQQSCRLNYLIKIGAWSHKHMYMCGCWKKKNTCMVHRNQTGCSNIKYFNI